MNGTAAAWLALTCAAGFAPASRRQAQSVQAQSVQAQSVQAQSTLSIGRDLQRRLVAVNTTRSDGATTPAAELLASRFRAAGFAAADVLVIGPSATQKHHVVRLRGRSRDNPMLFNAHLDVVEAPRLVDAGYAHSLDAGGRELENEPVTMFTVQAAEKVYLDAMLTTPALIALLCTTCVTTMMRGGSAPNAISQEPVATVICRTMPGESAEGVVERLRRAVDDGAVVFTVPAPPFESGPSMPTPAIIALVERAVASIAPVVTVFPYMEAGGTDTGCFRNAGIPAYGMIGLFGNADDWGRMHRRDERIPVGSFRDKVRDTEHLLAADGGFPPPSGAAR